MPVVLVDLLAILPEGLGLCTTCEAFLSQAGVEGNRPDRVMESLPPEWRAEYNRLTDLVLEVSRRFGDAIQIRIIDPRSLQGMGIALRHRIRRYPAFVVAGRKTIYGIEKSALEAALTDAGALPGRQER
jgi:hypothetical protein